MELEIQQERKSCGWKGLQFVENVVKEILTAVLGSQKNCFVSSFGSRGTTEVKVREKMHEEGKGGRK